MRDLVHKKRRERARSLFSSLRRFISFFYAFALGRCSPGGSKKCVGVHQKDVITVNTRTTATMRTAPVLWYVFLFFSNGRRSSIKNTRSQARRDARFKQELAARVKRRRPPQGHRGRAYVASQGIESCPRTLESTSDQERQRVVVVIIIIAVCGGVVAVDQPCVMPGLSRALKSIVAGHNASSVQRMGAVHMRWSGCSLRRRRSVSSLS